MILDAFETIVAEEAAKIPEKFLKRLKNVAFVVEEEPGGELLEEMEIPEGETLLGVFEGANLGEQGAGPWEMPGRIVVFKNPTEEEAEETGASVREVVRDTLWHEVAHYLGMDEHEVTRAEERRETGKKKNDDKNEND
ncbi:MAG: metallopeptidase family protein [Candidatus Liptonbacteria bacterium]|nr:metallopeptidase family protein [Candidatus Liptonbacteria bacterium]